MKLGTLTPSFRLGGNTPSRIYRGSNLVFLNPLSLSPALWLSDTGSDLARWEDLSGNGRHAVQSTPASRPSIVSAALNGRQVRRFNGTSQFLRTGALSATLSQPVDWFVVFKATNTINRRVFDVETISGATGPRNTMLLNGGASHIFAGNLLTTSYSSTSWGINHARFNGSNAFWTRNGASLVTGNAGSEGCSSVVIGAFRTLVSDFFQGDIAEILVFQSALSTADRQAVETYLNAKWAIY
jgi:hypothetical protein